MSYNVAVNIIRMIKLFGWEEKVEARIDEKREAEMQQFWKKSIFNIVRNNLKYGLFQVSFSWVLISPLL